MLLFFSGLVLAANSFAASYTTTQITNNTYADEYTKINAQGDVIWTAWVNTTDTGWTIFKYDAATQTTAPISTSSVFFDSHRINNRGDVVWMGYDGTDQEIFLYEAATKTVKQLTDDALDDTDAQISDNGDVAWFEQRCSNVCAFLYRYDAKTKTVASIEFPGAARQSQPSMNARGDIAWNAEVTTTQIQNGQAVPVTNSQDVLLFNAATGKVRNLTNSYNSIDGVQRVLDNGDVVFEAYDELTFIQSLKVYRADNGRVTRIASDVSGGYRVGSMGHAVWSATVTVGTTTLHTLSLYNPVTRAVTVISRENSSWGPFIDGVSARGDVAWRSIVGTNWYSRLYNTATRTSVDLLVSQNSPYELSLADNGDAAWSMWDGADYEVYSYQVATGSTTQLTHNTVDDGVISMNASGSMVFNRWYPNDSEVVIAVPKARNPR
jgi:hypothetical protein